MAGNGMPYFPLDCQLDDKFKLLKAEFGSVTYAVIIGLYQRIYGGDGGYYCRWDEEVALMFADEIKTGVNVVSEVLRAAIRRGIFDDVMYHKHRILTSHGIQKRFFKVTRKDATLEIVDDYLLVNVHKFGKFVNESAEFVYKSSENVRKFQQTKLNQNKPNETISPAGYAEDVIELFNNTCESLPRASYTPWRRDAIAALDAPIETFETVFAAAEKSEYLSGRSGEWVSCGLDWLLKPGNFQKVLEGTYDRQKSEKRNNRAMGHAQRRYSRDEMNLIGVDLIDTDMGGKGEI